MFTFSLSVSKRYEDLIDQIASTKPEKVVSSIVHAAISFNAKERYVIGIDAHTIWMAISTLPTSIGDWIGSKLAAPIQPKGSTKSKND